MKSVKYILLVALFPLFAMVQKKGELDFKRAEFYYKKGLYFKALEYYELLEGTFLEFERGVLWHKGMCQYNLMQYDQSTQTLLTFETRYGAEDEVLFVLGELLMIQQEYKKAKNVFLKVEPEYPGVKARIASCDSVSVWHEKSPEVFALTQLNSNFCEITPAFHQGSIVFSSSRERGVILPKSPVTGEPYLDLWVSKYQNGHWKKPTKYKSSLNTPTDDYALQFSDDGRSVFLTRTEAVDSSSIQVSKLYNYEADKERWKKPLVFNYDKSSVSFMHPSVSKSGDIIFFASDLPEGYGGIDIYFCIRIEGKWSKPINAGDKINTPEDEIFPCYNDGVLFFSSNGHPGYGGFDLYKSVQGPSGWGDAQNLHVPVNSSANDVSMMIFEGEYYFSSNRTGGKGGYDIYSTTH